MKTPFDVCIPVDPRHHPTPNTPTPTTTASFRTLTCELVPTSAAAATDPQRLPTPALSGEEACNLCRSRLIPGQVSGCLQASPPGCFAAAKAS